MPHDEGTLGLSAERVLLGEIPHHDFADPYSGGLSVLNAVSFRLFGIRLASLRIPLVAFTLACVPAVFYLASRFTSYVGAAAVAFASIVWSVANYPAALPSWYNLFFALFGTAALARHIETAELRWLVVAGVCGGLSIAIKISGLYFVAAVLLFLLFREQTLSSGTARQRERSSNAYSPIVVAGLVAFVVALFLLVRARAGAAEIFQFWLPGGAVAAVLAVRELGHRARATDRLRILARLFLPFFAGIALVVVPLLIAYATAGDLASLVRGVLILPLRRVAFAAVGPVPVSAVLATVPLAILIAGAPRARPRSPLVDITALAAVAALILWMAASGPRTYRFVWYSLLTLIPVLVMAGSGLLARAAPPEWNGGSAANGTLIEARRPQLVLLLLAMAAMTGLVQFPFAAPVYFCYVAPFALLAALAVMNLLPPVPRRVSGSILLFYTVFGLVFVNPGVIYTTRFTRVTGVDFEPLALARGGIAVPRAEKTEYEELVRTVRRRAKGAYMYAGPDSPEVYFLTGLRNPTRTIFDFFEARQGHVRRTLAAIEQQGVSVIALNHKPAFSGPLPGLLVWELRNRFPHSTIVGRFEVRWR
ncbi:MAG: glycosyltransferase family 39 protein [Gemmatimonadaceae bacterium]